MSAWELHVLPELGSNSPVSCVSHPGDTIFVPDSWAHATTNLDEAIGIGWQVTNASINSCKFGKDYMCLIQSLVSVPFLNVATQPARYRELFATAEEMTGGSPFGLLRFLGPYWRASPAEGKILFKRQHAS